MKEVEKVWEGTGGGGRLIGNGDYSTDGAGEKRTAPLTATRMPMGLAHAAGGAVAQPGGAQRNKRGSWRPAALARPSR